jgi:hypothetical protein
MLGKILEMKKITCWENTEIGSNSVNYLKNPLVNPEKGV